jgi:hypothetical protein
VNIPHKRRQEVFNVLLAQLLQERGIVSAPEEVLQTAAEPSRKMPDVLVDYAGLRIAIEGEVDDQPNYAEKALESARKRVEQGIAHIGVAVIYAAGLRELDFALLMGKLAECELRIAVISEAGTTDYRRGNVDDLADMLRRTFGELVKEDVVAKAVQELEGGIDLFAGAVMNDTGTVGRLAQVLGIQELPKREKQRETAEEG